MSFLETLRGYQPVENGSTKKELIGDAVCSVEELSKFTSKKGDDWIVLRAQAIHLVNDKKGRNTTLKIGDEISKLYNPTKEDDMKRFANDMFTAGVPLDLSSEEAFQTSCAAATGKLIYFRTWIQEDPKDGKRYQRIAVKSKNMVTPENSIPQMPF